VCVVCIGCMAVTDLCVGCGLCIYDMGIGVVMCVGLVEVCK